MSGTYVGNKPVGAQDFATDTPIGTIAQWSSLTLPLGWIECNGQSTAPYPELAIAVGSNVPDLRGEFIRGYDNNRGVDSGRILGSSQAEEVGDHTQNVADPGVGLWSGNSPNFYGATTGTAIVPVLSGNGSVLTAENPAGDETRPRNVALIYIIRAFNVIKENGAVNHYVGKNYVINPDFQINQRGFAGGALTVGTYGIDRWRCGGLGDINVTYSAGEATITGAGLHQQSVEFLQGLAGKTVTLSWEGTSQANVYRANGDDIDSRNNSPYTFVMPSTSLGVGIHEYIGFSTGTLKNVKLEVGATPSPYEPPEPATELSKCQRYFQSVALQVGTNIADQTNPLQMLWAVQMRDTPTLSLQNGFGAVFLPRYTSGFIATANASQVAEAYLTANAEI